MERGRRLRLLLDTHTLIWWFLDRDELSRSAHKAVGDEDNPVYISAASIFEIATKHRIGKLPEVGALIDDLPERLKEQRFDDLPISLAHGRRAGGLIGAHKDPFDRMLAAQAILEGLTLVSADAALDQFGVQRIW